MVERSVAARGWKEELVSRTHRIVEAVTLLYDTIIADTCHYVPAKTHTMHTTNNETQCEVHDLGDDVLSRVAGVINVLLCWRMMMTRDSGRL